MDQNTPTSTDSAIPLGERLVEVGHCWQRDVPRGGPVYVTAVVPWLETLHTDLNGLACQSCAVRLATSDAGDGPASQWVLAHEGKCRYLAGLIKQGIADGILTEDGEAAA